MANNRLQANSACGCMATILIVEDQVFNLCLMCSDLEAMNIHFDIAGNGRCGVDLYKNNMSKQCCGIRYRLVITDLNMPVMGGLDCSKEINKFQRHLNTLESPGLGLKANSIHTPVVCFSAFAENFDIGLL
jgi:CheY-like chemotaxis protein